ncbi:MAG: Spy/CpxP family protein refolding chaperone [Deltaproteobacteria bacterium]|jgi:Spy/CpxP family protein refolding chaperone
MVKKHLTYVFICIFISAALLFSGCRSHSPDGRAEFMVDYIAETLDLNEEQRAQLEEIKEEFLSKAREMHSQKEAMHAELMAELRKETIDQQRLKELISQKREQMAEVMDLAVVRLAEFHKTLSPEQREKLVEKIEWFHEKHQHNWE